MNRPVLKRGNRLITPGEFAKAFINAMHKAERKHKLRRGSILAAWINESPLFRLSNRRKTK